MLLPFPECCHCLLNRGLPEAHPVTRFDLSEKRKVCADHGGYFSVAPCDGLHKKDDGLAVSWDLNCTGRNALGDNGIPQALFPKLIIRVYFGFGIVSLSLISSS